MSARSMPMQQLTSSNPGRSSGATRPSRRFRATSRRWCARCRSPPATSTSCSSAGWRGRGPFPFGHECVAEVTEVGDAVSAVAPGDVVGVPFQISCGECEGCRRGRTGDCERVERMAMYGLPMGTNYGGFLSDSARVPFADAMLVPVPDDIEPRRRQPLRQHPRRVADRRAAARRAPRLAGADLRRQGDDRAIRDLDRARARGGAGRRRGRQLVASWPGAGAGRDAPRRGFPEAPRAVPDHRRRERRPGRASRARCARPSRRGSARASGSTSPRRRRCRCSRCTRRSASTPAACTRAR